MFDKNKYQREWKKKNKEKIREYVRKYREKNKGRIKRKKWVAPLETRRKYRHDSLVKKAGRLKPNSCEICENKEVVICYDHCHKTNKFRGWICSRCNVTLGFARDSPELLQKMINYLNK